MNIDFIKWMCDKAEGFTYRGYEGWCSYAVCTQTGVSYADEELETSESSQLLYSLLLQRAIEGVNRDTINYITQRSGDINVNNWHGDIDCDFNFNSSIDQAKESALMYIYEQEKEL